MSKQLPGELTISRYNSTDQIKITLYDVASGVECLAINLDAKSLALALTGLGNVDCKFDLHAKYVGMEFQHKTEKIAVSKELRYSRLTDRQAKDLVKGYETDGWLARLSDLGNPHRIDKDGNYSVGFTRYVDPETKEPVT